MAKKGAGLVGLSFIFAGLASMRFYPEGWELVQTLALLGIGMGICGTLAFRANFGFDEGRDAE